MNHRRAMAVLLAGAPPVMSTVTTALLWLPWTLSGTTHRSAYALAGALRGAGLMSRTPARLFVIAVAVVPGLAAAAWLLSATGWRRWAGLAVTGAGGLACGCAIGIRQVGRAAVTPAVTMEVVTGILTALVGLIQLTRSPADREATP